MDRPTRGVALGGVVAGVGAAGKAVADHLAAGGRLRPSVRLAPGGRPRRVTAVAGARTTAVAGARTTAVAGDRTTVVAGGGTTSSASGEGARPNRRAAAAVPTTSIPGVDNVARIS